MIVQWYQSIFVLSHDKIPISLIISFVIMRNMYEVICTNSQESKCISIRHKLDETTTIRGNGSQKNPAALLMMIRNSLFDPHLNNRRFGEKIDRQAQLQHERLIMSTIR